MIIIPKRQIWTRQPTEPVDIDWSNPLTNGLAFANPLRPIVGMMDLVQRQFATTELSSIRSNNFGLFPHFDTQLKFAKHPLGFGIGSYPPTTISWIQEFSGDVNTWHTPISLNPSAGLEFDWAVIQHNGYGEYYQFSAGVRKGGSNAVAWSEHGAITNAPVHYVLVMPSGFFGDQTTWVLYKNEVKLTTQVTTSYGASYTGEFLLAKSGDGYVGALGNVLIWNRALEESEAKSLYKRQWQIYKRRSRHVFVGASGGGASASLTGSAISTAVGSLAVSITVPLSGNSLTSTSGALGPGLALGLSGSAENLNAGTVSCSVGLELSGNSQAFAFGTVTASSGYFASLTGSGQSFSSGSLSPEIELALSGHSLSLAQGTVVVGASYIVALTGLGQTLSSGTLAPEIELSVNGQAQTLAFGIFSPDIQTTLTGRSMTLTPGTLSIAGGSGGIGSLDPATIAAIAAAIWSDPRAPTIAKLLAIKDG